MFAALSCSLNNNSYVQWKPALLALSAAVVLSGCSAKLPGSMSSSSDLTTASIAQPSMKDTAAAGKKWEADPGNVRLGMAYAAQLQALGNTGERARVIGELAKRNPDNAQLQALYGKELVQSGKPRQGEKILRKVMANGKADWKAYSALGSALDQQGRHSEARQFYSAALKAKPEKISILNNLGMSYMLEGNLKEAEATLRKAQALPAGQKHPRIRQNLALAVGLQGRFDEAKSIASKDLPPEVVEANMTYLRKMLSQQNTWQKLKSAKAE